MNLVDQVLLIALGLVIAFRMAWALSYYRMFWRGSPRRDRLASLRWATRAPSAQLYRSAGEAAEAVSARHREFFAASAKQVETLLLVGSVALAAWTQLFTGSGQHPGDTLSSLSKGLLLTSALILIGGPGLFRWTGGHLTYIGRESTTMVGYAALVLSLASMVADLLGVAGAIVALLIAVLVAARDFFETRMLIGSHQYLQTDPPGSGTPDPAPQQPDAIPPP